MIDNQSLFLTYLAQVRQRRTSALIFPLKNAHITPLILRMKLRAKYGMWHREIVTIGIVHAAVLAERNRNTGALLKGAGIWRNMVAFSLSQSRAKVAV